MLLIALVSGALILGLASPPTALALACGDVQARGATYVSAAAVWDAASCAAGPGGT